MHHPLPILCCAAALGCLSPVQGNVVPIAAEAQAQRAETPQEHIYREFLQATTDMWFLLSGVSNREDACAAAPRFTELVNRICTLDEQLSHASTESGLPAEVEAEVHEDAETAAVAGALETLQVRILEAFEDVNAEFLSLCRVHCYSSAELATAFVAATDTGMFSEEALAQLSTNETPMSDMESEEELARLRSLEEPDRAVLSVLQQVKDAASAEKAAEALASLSRRLHNLAPQHPVDHRSFAERYRAGIRAAFEPLSPLLWGIRTELVRIAALPGYDTEPYDAFSDALNSVYEDLDAAHSSYFNDVFDASFRADLDDALQENAPTAD
ncbi:MAG: hypothetical protein MJ051_04145 [Akkermansia sp.]|nr:hypothetical protein [Akkermansia sp.]